MAINDSDLEGFELVSTKRPEKAGGVTVSQIPAMLVKLLEQEAPKALSTKAKPSDYEIILSIPVRHTPDEKKSGKENAEAKAEAEKAAKNTVQQLASYAAAWGKGQEPKLYIHKIPNRKDMADNVARLAVELDSEVGKDNRPGRR
jgi:hypothetical protein